MMNLASIDRHVRAGRWEEVLEALSAQGLDLPLALRVRLAGEAAACAGLGLWQTALATNGNAGLTMLLTGRLLASQNPDGSFGGRGVGPVSPEGQAKALPAGTGDPLATAAAVAGLTAVLGQARGPAAGAWGDAIVGARDRALAALTRMQTLEPGDVGFVHASDRTVEDRALAAAFILWLLGGDADFRQSVRLADLLDWFEQRQERLEDQTARYWELATGRQGHSPHRSPARQALAA